MYQMSKCGAYRKLSKHQSSIVKLLALIAIVLPALLAYGQTVPPAKQAADSPANVEAVSLDVVADYKNHKPVLDLKPQEIAVTDDGSPVTLDSLRLVTGIQENPHLITLVFDRAGSAAESGQQMDPSTANNTRDAAAKILKMIPESGFTISVLDVEGRLRLQRGFTSDRNALTHALIKAIQPDKSGGGGIANEAEKQLIAELQTGNDSSGKPVSPGDRARDQALFSALSQSGKIAQDQHIRHSFAGLLALVDAMQQIPHRKTVIYFTSFQKTQIDSRARDAVKSIIGSANQAGVSIDVVDLNSFERPVTQLLGLNSGSTLFHVPGTLPNEPYEPGQGVEILDNSGILRHVNEDTNDDLRYLAEGTGGSYITEDKIQESIKRMIQDMTTYYEASYLTPIKEYDGKFHSVAVKPLRAGLKIRTQSGYLALPPHSGADAKPQPFELPLLKILNQSQLPADVPFRAAVLNMGDQPEGIVSALAIETPFSSLEIHDDPSSQISSASLSIEAVIKDQSGMVIERFSEDIPRRRIAKDTEMDKLGAISFLRHFNAHPGHYILEAAVVDHNSGKAGAQRSTFEVRSSTGAPSLSHLLLVRKTEQFRTEDDPAEPLRHGNDRVTPNLTGQLQPGAKEVSVFFTAHSDPHAAQAASLILQVFFDGKPLGGQPMLSHPDSGQEFSSYLVRFSINPPQDGVYEVKAILTQGGESAESNTSFTLMGSTAALASDAPAAGSSPLPPHPVGPLNITFPPNPSGQPTPDEINSILADATKYAMAYRDSLPNFMCEQVTNRSVDPDGARQWKHKDRLIELLTYVNHEEKRTILDLDANGVKKDISKEDDIGVLSFGEFGNVIAGLFQPSSQASFQWRQTGMLEDGTVQVFDYRVARENSTFNLRGSSKKVITVGYHGQVFIDSATRSVRRITQVGDDVPEKFPIQGASVSVDYDYVLINDHDYMLPIGAQVVTKTGRWKLDLNEIEYRAFRRFGSTSKIIFDPPAEKH